MTFARATAWPPALLVALTLTSILSTHIVKAKLPYEITLDSKSYTLSVEILTRSTNGVDGWCNLEEFYSHWQKRIRINYHTDGLPGRLLLRRGSIFASEKQVFMVNRDWINLRPCTQIKQKLVDKSFQLDQIVGLLGEPTHANEVGTARLLRMLARKSQSFKQDDADRDVFKVSIEEFAVTVSYQHLSSLTLGIPSKVLIERGDGFKMVVRYKLVVLLASGNQLVFGNSQLRATSIGANEILFDMFAIDRNSGCSIELASGTAQNESFKDAIQSALTQSALEHRFSFSAQVKSDKLGPSTSMSVMYEPHVNTLRVEQQFENRVASTLVSFAHDRVYHLLRRSQVSRRDTVLETVLEMDLDSDDVSCVVSTYNVIGKLYNPNMDKFTLGAMLLGAARNATYLGLAQVRGIEAHAFEAHNNQLPMWLESPLIYQRANKSYSEFRIGSPDETYPLVVTTIFYFARGKQNGENDSMILGNRLLHIEIFKKTNLDTPRGSLNISIYDFSWLLHRDAPTGERTEDFLSLGAHCLAPSSKDNHYARVELTLEAVPVPDGDSSWAGPASGSDWLEVATKRNLAVTRAVYEQFKVPPALMYDVESRYVKPTNGTSRESVVATMLTAERAQAPVTLTYLGRASKVKARYYSLRVAGFQACFWLAAHKHAQEHLFAYQAITGKCYIRQGKPMGDIVEENFELRPSGTLEVYRVSHWPGRKLTYDRYITLLENKLALMNTSQPLVLSDPAIASLRKLPFAIKSAHLDHLNEKIAYDLDDEHHLDDINKFAGLGLVASDKQNKLIGLARRVLEPATGSDDKVTPPLGVMGMSFERCQEACLLDLECRAYSVCLVGGQFIECVLTSFDFKISTVVLELMSLQATKSKLGNVFPIMIAGGVNETSELIHVKKHPSCELHNKLYKHLFKDVGKFNSIVNSIAMYPVTHSEQCAEICFQKTLESMRNETQRLQSISKETLLKDPGNFLKRFEFKHSVPCSVYAYLDKRQVDNGKLFIAAEQIVGKNTDGPTQGYCRFGEISKNVIAKNAIRQMIELRNFAFDFSVLYGKQYGISLANIKKSPEEENAFREVFKGKDLSPVNLKSLGDFLERAGNTGKIVSLDVPGEASQCARMCFMQVAPIWPACRSFDFVEVKNKIDSNKSKSLCVFNTLTLGQLQANGRLDEILQDNRQDWVQAGEHDEVRMWHYEPREGLVARSLEEFYKVALVETECQALKLTSRWHTSSFNLFFMILIVISVGFVAGTRLSAASDIFSRAGFLAKRQEDKEILVEASTSPVLTFEDVVRAEQQAPASDENDNL